MNIDERRQAIALLEPLMALIHDDFWELQPEAVKLCKRLEREFSGSDISTVNGLLLAALINHLKYELRQDEQDLAGSVRLPSFQLATRAR